MKKFMILIVCLFLVSCSNDTTGENTVEAIKTYEAYTEHSLEEPSLNLDLIKFETIVNINDLVLTSYDFVLMIDGQMIEDETLYFGPGVYDIEVYSVDGQVQSHPHQVKHRVIRDYFRPKDEPSYYLNLIAGKYYIANKAYFPSDFVSTNADYKVKVDGQVVETINLPPGIHELIVEGQKGQDSFTYKIEVEMISRLDPDYLIVYKDDNLKYEIVIPKTSLVTVNKTIAKLGPSYENYVSQIELNDSSLKYLYAYMPTKPTGNYPLEFDFEEGTYKVQIKEDLTSSLERLNDNFLYTIRDQMADVPGQYVLYDQVNETYHVFNTTKDSVHVNKEKAKILFVENVGSTYDYYIYDLSDEGLKATKALTKMTDIPRGIEWLDNEISFYTYDDLMMDYFDYEKVKEKVHKSISYDGNTVTYTTVALKPENNKNEEITLYKSVSNQPQNPLYTLTNMVETSKSLDLYSVINNDLVLWFEIKLITGEDYYAYRKLRYNERQTYKKVSLLLKNDMINILNDDQDKSVSFIDQDQGYYVIDSESVGITRTVISAVDSEVLTKQDEAGNYMVLSKDKKVSIYYINNHNHILIGELSHEKLNVSKVYERPDRIEVLFGDIESDYVFADIELDGFNVTCDPEDLYLKKKDIYVRINVPSLNKQKEHNDDSEITGKLNEGEIVKIINFKELNKTWYQLEDGSWIAAELTTCQSR